MVDTIHQREYPTSMEEYPHVPHIPLDMDWEPIFSLPHDLFILLILTRHILGCKYSFWLVQNQMDRKHHGILPKYMLNFASFLI